MIISGGENIASSEVERVVYQMPQIREVAIIGLPDEKWGERPVAVVVLNAGQTSITKRWPAIAARISQASRYRSN